MKIKTFPLQFSEEDLQSITTSAESIGITKKAFIHLAIEEKIMKTQEKILKK